MLVSAVPRICETSVGDVAAKYLMARKRGMRMTDAKRTASKTRCPHFDHPAMRLRTTHYWSCS